MSTASRSDDRNVRVFVSSTFRDMAAERDVLVGRVFPRLREICAARSVAFSEIDLRWGLTDEEVAEGKVLPICLAEIKRCMPYFIGLLGERYGWVPHEIPEDLLEREGWLRPHAGSASVTELEILYGVLNNPEMRGHAAFYFRDPEYIGSDRFLQDTVDRPADRPLFSEEATPEEVESLGREEAERRASARRRRLAELKERIRGSHALTQEFADPDELGELVFADLKAVIDERFPEETKLNPLAAESRLHDFFAESRSRVYARRASYFETLDDFAEEDDPGVLAVLGDSGSGKSALLATWGLGYRSRHPKDLLLMHFIGSSQKSTELGPMLSRLNYELGRYLEDEADADPAEASSDSSDQIRIFKERIRAAGGAGKVVLVLDALNQLAPDEGAHELAWLPESFPDGVRLVVSTLRGAAYDELKRRGWLGERLKVRPLERAEREELIDLYLGRALAKHLSDAQKDAIITLPQSESPLYIRILLDELRVWGDHATLNSRLARLTEAASIAALLELILARYESEFENHRPGLVGDAMRMIWASRQGLQEGELLELLGEDGVKLPAAYWSPLHIAASEMLIERGGLLDFAHVYFEAAVEDRYVPDEATERATREKLVDYFAAADEPAARALEEVPTQLVALGAWSRLAELLTDSRWFLPLWGRGQFEVRSLWARIHRESQIRAAEAYELVVDEGDEDPRFLMAASELLFALGARTVATRFLEQYVSEGGADDQDALRLLSWIYMYRGDTQEALDLMLRWEQVCIERGDQIDRALALGNQAVIHRDRGELGKAMELLLEEDAIFREFEHAAGLQASVGSQAVIHRDRGELGKAMELHREQERLCREVDHPALPVAIGNQAVIHRDRGELDKAMELLLEEAQLCRELDNPGDLQVSLGNQALIHRDRGDLDRALELHEEEERICRKLDNQGALQASLGNQAVIHHDRGDSGRAMDLHHEEEQICRKLSLPASLQASLGNQAVIHRERGELERAVELLAEQEQICRRLERPSGLQVSLGNQAVIQRELGDLDRALELHQEEEQICRKLENVASLHVSLGNQALINRDRGDIDRAEKLLAEKERICRDLPNPAGLQVALGSQALSAVDRGELDRALELHREEERICREIGLPDALQASLGNRAAILAERGDLDASLELLAEQEGVCRELGDHAARQRALCGLAVIHHVRSDPEAALEVHRIEEEVCRELGDREGHVAALANQYVVMRELGMGQATERRTAALEIAREGDLGALVDEIDALDAPAEATSS